jgi:hypothetical protein
MDEYLENKVQYNVRPREGKEVETLSSPCLIILVPAIKMGE